MFDNSSNFQEVAKQMLPMIPEGYEKAVIHCKLSDGHSNLQFRYDGPTQKELNIDPDTTRAYRISQLLEDIQSETKQPGKQAWSRCTFTLFPDGKFKFDVEYDD
jgi:hypothetical protein